MSQQGHCMLKPEGDEERNVNHMFCNVNKSRFKAKKQTAAGNPSGRVAGKLPNISTRSERHFQLFFVFFLLHVEIFWCPSKKV